MDGGDASIDAALAALYDSERDGAGERTARGGGLNASAPRVARWLGDIRRYFPSTVVQVMQADAIERLNLARLLLEPEMLDAVEPDIHLVGTLLSLNHLMPAETKASDLWHWQPTLVSNNIQALAGRLPFARSALECVRVLAPLSRGDHASARRTTVARTFDLRANSLMPDLVDNPDAGKEHHFRAYRLKKSPDEAVKMRKLAQEKGADTDEFE